MHCSITYKIARRCNDEEKFSDIISILRRELPKFNEKIRPFKFAGIMEHNEDYTFSLLLNHELVGLRPFNPLEENLNEYSRSPFKKLPKDKKEGLIKELKSIAEVLEGLMNGILKFYGFSQIKVLEFAGSVSIPGSASLTFPILDCTEQKELKEIGKKLLELADNLPEKAKEALILFTTYYGLIDITCEEGAVLQLGKCCEVLIRFTKKLPNEVRDKIKEPIEAVREDIYSNLNNFQKFFLIARHSGYLRDKKNPQLPSRLELRYKIKEFSEKLAEIAYEVFRKVSATQER